MTLSGARMGSGERIPLVDLSIQDMQVREGVLRGWKSVLDRTDFILAPEVEQFEEAFAAFCGVTHCIGVGNGTDALEFTLRAAHIGPGEEVILPANSFVATAGAIVRTGALPVFVDVEADSLLIDPVDVEKRLSARTKAVIAVHLYGQIPRIEDLRSIAPNAILIEDAAQAQGAKRFGVGIGGHGIAAATSFYPGKNLGAYGDAGAVLTDSPDVAKAVRYLRNHGSEERYKHTVMGFNSRLDSLQAVVLNAKLEHLSTWNDQRRRAADHYRELLHGLPHICLPDVVTGNEHVWHLFVVETPRRDRVMAAMHEAGIQAEIHYPTPIPLLEAYRGFGYREGDFPISEAASRRIVSLPLFPGITVSQQEWIAETIRRALR